MEIEIKGMDKLIAKLGRVTAADTLVPPMHSAVFRVQRDMAKYPPQARNTPYRRTGTLGRRWTTKVERIGGGVQGRVGNNTEYAPFVQSHQFQARQHKMLWQTDRDVLESGKRDIERLFADAVNKALGG